MRGPVIVPAEPDHRLEIGRDAPCPTCDLRGQVYDRAANAWTPCRRCRGAGFVAR